MVGSEEQGSPVDYISIYNRSLLRKSLVSWFLGLYKVVLFEEEYWLAMVEFPKTDKLSINSEPLSAPSAKLGRAFS